MARPFLKLGGADVGDRVRADQVGKFRNSHKACVRLRSVLENVRNNRDRGEPLLLQGDSVVQTARRATPSISYPGYHYVGVPVQGLQYFRPGW